MALSPVSLHRALEGDMDAIPDSDPASNEGGVASGLHNLHHHHHHHHHGDNFFSTSSSSSSALSDVPLLDDSVFHQVKIDSSTIYFQSITFRFLFFFFRFRQLQLQRCYPTLAVWIYSRTWTRATAVEVIIIINNNTFKIASDNTLICLNILPAALEITSTIQSLSIRRAFTDTILWEQMAVSSINTTEATCRTITINTKRASEWLPVWLALDLVLNRHLRRRCRRSAHLNITSSISININTLTNRITLTVATVSTLVPAVEVINPC